MTNENSFIKNEPLIFKFLYVAGGICLLIHLILFWFFNISYEFLQGIGFMTLAFYFGRRLFLTLREKKNK